MTSTSPAASASRALKNLSSLIQPRISAGWAPGTYSQMTRKCSTADAAALACLKSGRYPDGEDAMMLAEKDWPPRGELGKAVPVEILADRHAEILRV